MHMITSQGFSHSCSSESHAYTLESSNGKASNYLQKLPPRSPALVRNSHLLSLMLFTSLLRLLFHISCSQQQQQQQQNHLHFLTQQTTKQRFLLWPLHLHSRPPFPLQLLFNQSLPIPHKRNRQTQHVSLHGKPRFRPRD